MPRSLDDPELGAKYQGPLPQPPEEIKKDKEPDRSKDPAGYVRYWRAKYDQAIGEEEYLSHKWDEVINQCPHKENDGSWTLVQYDNNSKYLRCTICEMAIAKDHASELGFPHTRP